MEHADIFALVKQDLDTRNAIGHKSYGGKMVLNDSRDWLLEAYLEALDFCVYAKAELLRRGISQEDTARHDQQSIGGCQ